MPATAKERTRRRGAVKPLAALPARQTEEIVALLRAAAAAGPGRRPVGVEALGMAEAGADPVFGVSALEAAAAAYGEAQGLGDGAMAERIGRRGTWTTDRVPGTAAVIRLIRPDAGLRKIPLGATRRAFLADALDVTVNLHEGGCA